VSGSGVSGDPWRIETYDGAATESPDTRPALADRFGGMKVWTTDTRRLFMWDVAAAAWRILHEPVQTYTPTLTGITLGTGSRVRFGYRRRNREVWLIGRIVLGVGGQVTGGIEITLPVNADITVRRQSGPAIFAQTNAGFINFPATIDVDFVGAGVASIYFIDGVLTPNTTHPFVWASGDEIIVSLKYWTA
jgi:hypothetical protein